MRTQTYTTPTGSVSRLFVDCLKQSHLLIAGATGSGKSVFENGLIHAALYTAPSQSRFILIDPKGTELIQYDQMPHTLYYAYTTEECVNALQYAYNLTQTRFNDMRKRQLRTYDGSNVYIIIDELMYLLNRPDVKKRVYNLLLDLLVIARAARIHVIACTQNPTRDTLPPTLRCNFDARIALRTATKQDSRNVLEMAGCERLPNPAAYGKAYGYYRRGADCTLYELPHVTESEIQTICNYWTRQHYKHYRYDGRRA